MKNLIWAAFILAALPAVSLSLPTGAAARMLDRPQPVTRSNELLYSYRHHYRAYGVNSLAAGTLPPDEVYLDPCYKWVGTPRGPRRKFVCRS